jgi:hypothetical protein
MQVVDVGKEFSSRLADRSQAITFVNKYLAKLLNEEAWLNEEPFIILDFTNVHKISPGFASQAFANFLDFVDVSPEKILKKIVFKNISNVQLEIINTELYGK